MHEYLDFYIPQPAILSHVDSRRPLCNKGPAEILMPGLDVAKSVASTPIGKMIAPAASFAVKKVEKQNKEIEKAVGVSNPFAAATTGLASTILGMKQKTKGDTTGKPLINE